MPAEGNCFQHLLFKYDVLKPYVTEISVSASFKLQGYEMWFLN